MTTLLDFNSFTPAERAALAQIARQREMGLTDEQIFSGAYGPDTQMLGGGYGYLDPAISLAGITSSYNLGRGNLAADARNYEYQLLNNPYNVVAANQYLADQGIIDPLMGGALGSVPKGPASKYVSFIDQMLGMGGENPSLPSQAAQSAQNPAASMTANQLGAASRSQGGSAQAAPKRDYLPLPLGAAQTGGAAQQRAARMLGATMNAGMDAPEFGQRLGRGEVPGLNTLTEKDFTDRMTGDQRAQFLGLIQSTGRTSDAAAAAQDYFRKYRHGGTSGRGATYR